MTNYSKVFIYFMLFACLEIPIITIDPRYIMIDTVIDALRVALFLMSFVHVFIMNYKDKRVKKYLIALFGIFLIELLITIINDGNYKTMFICFSTIWTASYFLYYYFTSFRKETSYIVCNYLLLLCSGNLISQLLFPNGLYSINKTYWTTPYYFLGGENNTITFSLCCVCFCLLIYKIYQIKFYLVASLIPTVTTLLSDSATSLVVMVLFWGLYLISNLFEKHYSLHKKLKTNIMMVACGIAVLFCLFSTEISIFSFFITGALGKDLTFTGRTYIWKRTIEYISQRPLLGYGLLNVDSLYSMLTASHQHNYYLHILFQGGICCFFLFIFIVNLSRKQLIKCEDKRIYNICSTAFFCFLISFIVESYDENLYILPFYILLSYINSIELNEWFSGEKVYTQ